MADHKYRVVREHIGDRAYAVGDERVAAPSDVAHLVPNVLEDKGPIKEKSAAKPEDKAEPKVSNKAEPKSQNKDNA